MFAKEVYVNRRNTLKTKVGSGILLFLGTGEAAVNYAGNAYRYRQDSTFNYYFGLTDPDLAAVIDLESGEEIIFGLWLSWRNTSPRLKPATARYISCPRTAIRT